MSGENLNPTPPPHPNHSIHIAHGNHGHHDTGTPGIAVHKSQLEKKVGCSFAWFCLVFFGDTLFQNLFKLSGIFFSWRCDE
jgi:hypothetical protein